MRKVTRKLTLALMLATACGAIAHAVPTGTDPVPPTHATGGTTSTITTILEVLAGVVL
jgi:hypothetical protein